MSQYRYSIKMLLKVKAWFKEHPDGAIDIPGLFPPERLNREQWQRWFIDCLNNKINRFDERKKFRKFDSDYYYEMRRAQSQINYPRLIIDWLPKDLKQRFAHRLRCNMEL